MALYVLNALIVPFPRDVEQAKFVISRISLDKAKELLTSQEFVSAIGHTGTTQVIKALTDIDVPTNRINVFFDIGDSAVAFVPRQRLPEGTVLSKEELLKLGIDIYHIVRVG
jgi:hypothetical protein